MGDKTYKLSRIEKRKVDEVIYLWDIEHTCIEHGALVQGEDGEWYCPQCEEGIPHCACGGAFRLQVFGGNVVYWCDKCGKEAEGNNNG